MGLVHASRILFCGLSIGLVSCGSGRSSNRSGADDCSCPAPGDLIIVTVPQDRIADVASVSGTGVCGDHFAATSYVPGNYDLSLTNEGVCHVNVSFRSGVPSFVTDINVTRFAGPCCAGLLPDSAGVSVPELADASTRN